MSAAMVMARKNLGPYASKEAVDNCLINLNSMAAEILKTRTPNRMFVVVDRTGHSTVVRSVIFRSER